MITVRYFAAVAEAAGVASETASAGTLGELRAELTAGRDEHFERVLSRCAVLVEGRRADDPATPLADGTTVDVLPPFAGG